MGAVAIIILGDAADRSERLVACGSLVFVPIQIGLALQGLWPEAPSFREPPPMTDLDKVCYRNDSPDMNVSLTPDLEELVQKKAQSGRYSSASEVVREALRLLAERDELREVELQALRAKVERGLDEAAREELVDGEEVFREVRSRRAARRPRAK